METFVTRKMPFLFNGYVIFLVRVIFVSTIQCLSNVPVNILHNYLPVVVFL